MTGPTDVDVVVVGGGFAGLYATHRFRNEMGLTVQSFEAGSGPGGTWYWNRYPGARCDFESIHYSYSFDEDLQKEWVWSERFAGQPEILSYLEHVADRFDLRRSYVFDTRVTSVVWDDENATWTVGTDGGHCVTARFVVAGAGNLSVAKQNEFPGEETFTGRVVRTSDWPEDLDVTGKRVGLIGTGSTGIQASTHLAREAAFLTVFQRTANFAAPLGNRPLEAEEMAEAVANYPALREASRNNWVGAPYPPAAPSALLATEDERREAFDQYYYTGGGFRMIISTFGDLLFDKQANDTISDYLRDRIRERVKDPVVAEMLCPTDHPYATKRPPFESGYYEMFNEEHVSLVDVRKAPIQEITPTGVRTADAEYELDVIVLATGFDAFTGPLYNMGIVGRDGATLQEQWAAGPETYLAIGVKNFPNLFTLMGPQSAAIHYNNPLAIEDHVRFASDMVAEVLSRGAETFEPTAEATEQWGRLIAGLADATLMTEVDSWYMGANIPGKPRAPLFFAGGAVLYQAIFQETKGLGFGGFAIDGVAAPLPVSIHLDPHVAIVLQAMLSMDQRPYHSLTLEEQRRTLEGFTMLQAPPRPNVGVTETAFPGPAGDRPVRIYTPAAEGPLPVVVFYHPGGWTAGSLDISQEPCIRLADELGAIVVSPDYRLAPESPFPAAPDDCFAALRWVAQIIEQFGGDPHRIAVAGESSGGNLAAVAALRARDEDGPALVAQVLLYPPIDPHADSESRTLYPWGPILSNEAVQQAWGLYLGDMANADSPLASPIKASSLAGLPPALVVTGEIDNGRDEAEDYGRALAEAGVPTQVVRFDGLIHAVLNMSALVPRVDDVYSAIVGFLAPLLVESKEKVASR